MASVLLYTVAFFCLVFATVLYISRDRWLYLAPIPEYVYSRLPSSFSSDIEDGFTSNDFDLRINVASGDGRAGLDPVSRREVKRIMYHRGIGFDEARRIHLEKKLVNNGIGTDGIPRDPKFVSFS